MVRRFSYEEITQWLRSEAARRGPGALMPTIAEVCQRFGIRGVQTVRNAYAPLLEDGTVERLDSPRRWSVVDHGQSAVSTPDHGPMLKETEVALEHALRLVRDIHLATPGGNPSTICPSAVLLELIRDGHSVVTNQVDERPLSALLAAALNAQPRLATECLRIPAGQTFSDGSYGDPDVLGNDSADQIVSLIEAKNSTNQFNWADGRDQLTRYRETYVGCEGNRVLVVPASRAAKIRAVIAGDRRDQNTPGAEIDQSWRIVTWEEIADWLVTNGQTDPRVGSALPVFRTLLRAR